MSIKPIFNNLHNIAIEMDLKNKRLAEEQIWYNLQNNGLILEYLSETLKNNPQVVLTAVQNNGLALKFASKQLQNSLKVVLTAVKKNGSALKFASDTLKDNEQVVFAAVMKN